MERSQDDLLRTPEPEKVHSNSQTDSSVKTTQSKIAPSPITPFLNELLNTKHVMQNTPSPYTLYNDIKTLSFLNSPFSMNQEERFYSPPSSQGTPMFTNSMIGDAFNRSYYTPTSAFFGTSNVQTLSFAKSPLKSAYRVGYEIRASSLEDMNNSLLTSQEMEQDEEQKEQQERDRYRIGTYDPAFVYQASSSSKSPLTYSKICMLVDKKESIEKKMKNQLSPNPIQNSSVLYTRQNSQISEENLDSRSLKESESPLKMPIKTESTAVDPPEIESNVKMKKKEDKDSNYTETDEDVESEEYNDNNDEDYEESYTLRKRIGREEKKEDAEDSKLIVGNSIGASDGRVHCKCRKSHCLKLYCECFARQLLCENCICKDCHNTANYKEAIEEAQKAILSRDPHAFTNKIVENANHSALYHSKGCNCKKSNCLKKYCECYQAGIPCGIACKCKDCYNRNLTDKKYTKRMKNASLQSYKRPKPSF